MLRNTLALADEAALAGSIGEYIHLAEIYGRGCTRLLHLLRQSPSSQGRLAAYLHQLLDEVLAEVQQDWPQL